MPLVKHYVVARVVNKRNVIEVHSGLRPSTYLMGPFKTRAEAVAAKLALSQLNQALDNPTFIAPNTRKKTGGKRRKK